MKLVYSMIDYYLAVIENGHGVHGTHGAADVAGAAPNGGLHGQSS